MSSPICPSVNISNLSCVEILENTLYVIQNWSFTAPTWTGTVDSLNYLLGISFHLQKDYSKLNSQDHRLPSSQRFCCCQEPYQKDNLLRHNLDVMHIQKNVMDNIIGRLLDMQEKMKGNFKACKELQEMDLRQQFHPYTAENGKTLCLQLAT